MEPDDLAVHDLSELRAALVAVDYTTERLRSLLSIREPVEAVLANTGRYSYFFANRLARLDAPVAVLFQLFFLSARVPMARLELLPPRLVSLLWSLGLVASPADAPDHVRGVVNVTEFEGRHFLSDPLFENRSGELVVDFPPDGCMPPHASSLELFRALRPLPAARSFLDVGCGSGCQSILLGGGAVRVTGFDVSPRAVGFARTNAMLNGIDATYVVADCESFRTDEPYDRVAFNAPDSETAFAFLNSGVDRLLTHDGEVFVWFTHEVTAIDGSVDNALRGRIDGVDRLHVEICLNADSPFALSRDMVRAHKLPAGTLLIKHSTEAGSYFDGLAKRQVVEVVSAVLSVQRREAGGGDVPPASSSLLAPAPRAVPDR